MVQVIFEEMAKGNFSFLILVVGMIQTILMWRNVKEKKDEGTEEKTA